ncbi:manganese-binding transcriptional regulator MntR [Hyphomicrobium sp. CS1BSMeth3]|uniref:manganese-binding transcriptional regulator MntR n=1 Tax=Hyphomicrobium sp. CS1BSMeth3 TaxID=1892844 RepID=UPI000931B6B7|nr:manganese-binding transcriptional regulator MntR [Hyphomicrobium sp. CS1BSMeth3]
MNSDEDRDRVAAKQAERFQRVREAHQTEMAEDYVELIADLIDEMGEARLVDLAQRLGVSKPTVSHALARLQRDGLVKSERYRSIFLTLKGRKLAISSRERHITVREFLMALGVDAETADADAEGIEHHVSARTIRAFRKFLSSKRQPTSS